MKKLVLLTLFIFLMFGTENLFSRNIELSLDLTSTPWLVKNSSEVIVQLKYPLLTTEVEIKTQLENFIDDSLRKFKYELYPILKMGNRKLKKYRKEPVKDGLIKEVNESFNDKLKKFKVELNRKINEKWIEIIKNYKQYSKKLSRLNKSNRTIGINITINLNPYKFNKKYKIKNKNSNIIKKNEWFSTDKSNDYKKQFIFDTKVWLNTIYPINGKKNKRYQKKLKSMLIRLFVFLKYSKVMYKENFGNKWKIFPYPVSTLLSHGGNIMVGIKKGCKVNSFAIINWIVTGKVIKKKFKNSRILKFKRKKKISRRIFINNSELYENKYILKKKSKLNPEIWICNLPLGGYGSFGADGSKIDNSGKFGGLYFSIMRGKKDYKFWKDGFLLGTLPLGIFGKKNKILKSHLSLNSPMMSNFESITGNNSWKELKSFGLSDGVPDLYNSMKIEIDDDKIINLLEKEYKKIKRKSDVKKLLNSFNNYR